MWQRIGKVLAIDILHGHDSIVLGTWGCGGFGNDANEIAGLFERALQNNFKGAYRRVIFAIANDFERLELLKPLELPDLPITCCLVPISVRSNGSFQRRHDKGQIGFAESTSADH